MFGKFDLKEATTLLYLLLKSELDLIESDGIKEMLSSWKSFLI